MPDRARPARARRILITRPAGRGTALARRLESRGATVDLRPTIAFAPPADRAAAAAALDRLAEARWVVVTSPTGATHLGDALREAGRPVPAGPAYAAVGPGTARALERLSVPVEVVAGSGDAEGLARDLEGRVGPGDVVVVVRPESSSREVLADALRARGAEVVSAPLYRTVAARECAEIARDVVAGSYDVVVFSSPSTFAHLRAAAGARGADLDAALHVAKVVAIGGVTEAALAAHGIRADAVAAAPTDEAIETAVASVW